MSTTLEKKSAGGAATVAKTATAQFIDRVQRDICAAMGEQVKLSAEEIRLIQNLHARIELAIEEQESQRVKKGKGGAPICWDNINIRDLSITAVQRVKLGLDASTKNHLSPTFRWIEGQKKYKCLLNIGFVGLDFIACKYSRNPIVDRRYELVHETDEFRVIKKSATNRVESYEFDIVQPFNRGSVVGGFAYYEFEDPRQNFVHIVTQRDFDKAKSSSPSGELFWGKEKWELEMQYKTLYRRGTDRVPIDSSKLGQIESDALMDIQATIDADDAAEMLANSDLLSLGSPSQPVTANGIEQCEPAQVESPLTSEGPEY